MYCANAIKVLIQKIDCLIDKPHIQCYWANTELEVLSTLYSNINILLFIIFDLVVAHIARAHTNTAQVCPPDHPLSFYVTRAEPPLKQCMDNIRGYTLAHTVDDTLEITYSFWIFFCAICCENAQRARFGNNDAHR